MSRDPASRRKRSIVPAIAGLGMVACCLAGPVVLGVLAGTAIHGWLGAVAAVAGACMVALVIALVLRRRRQTRGGC